MGKDLSETSSMQVNGENRRRLVLGLAVALALHEILAALVPLHRATIRETPIETITIAKIIKIEHRVKPTPKPTPRPSPTPQPVVHTKVIAETHTPTPIVNPAAPSQNHHVRRIASARPLVHTRYHSKPANIHVPTGGHGAGTSANAKANTGGIGPGGNGTGVNGEGNGTGGAPAAHEPCGFVEFLQTEEATVDTSTGRIWEHIMVRVHFPDGTDQTQPLDYEWYYSSKAQDPFMQETKEAVFQFPPADQRANEPPLVQYVMEHSTGDGITRLKDCPK
ncbi:MAG: hypothetical protein ABR508_05080 [Candidatus Baltobacteraceae bacterium]